MDYQLLLDQVEALVEPVLKNLNFELVEREFVLDQGRWVLRLYIDRIDSLSGRVTIDDCQTISRAIEGLLDVENLIPQRYLLEVSSPGLNRPLRKRKDFERFAGSKVEIKTKEGLEGRHHFTGLLKGLCENAIVVEQDGSEWSIPLDNIKKAKIKYDF